MEASASGAVHTIRAWIRPLTIFARIAANRVDFLSSKAKVEDPPGVSSPPERTIVGPVFAITGVRKSLMGIQNVRRARTRDFAGLLAFFLVLCAGNGPRKALGQRADVPPPKGPNLVILIGDDHGGGTLGIDGDPRRATPHLDALARGGVRFERAYCNAPVCTPSRQSFITGRLPHAVGVTQLSTPLPDSAVTLGGWLGGLGYETAAFGKMHFNGKSSHGFAERVDLGDWEAQLKAHPPEGGDKRRPWRPFKDPASVWLNSSCASVGLPAAAMDSTFFADRAIDFVKRPHDRPFALVVGFYDPHSPFRFPREWEGRFRADQFEPFPVSEAERANQPLLFAGLTPDESRGIRQAHYTAISFLDEQLGRIVDAIDASGHGTDTVVVYLGDNGYMLGQHGRFEKHCFYEPAVRVPLLIRWTGRISAGRRALEMVELVDLLPTLLELLGQPKPSNLHGESLAPLLEGRCGGLGRDFVFSEYLENEEAMVRSSRYKLIVGTGRRIRQDGYVTANPRPGPYERLYDLVADPDETTDLGARSDLDAIKAGLRKQLHDRLVGTRDGVDPVPSGLSELEAIHWCLVPRDRVPTPDRGK